MATRPKTAYVTGGASGIGKAVVEMLVQRGIKTVIADINLSAAEALAKSLNDTYRALSTTSGPSDLNTEPTGLAASRIASAVQVDISSWPSQLSAFQSSLPFLGPQVDLVFAIAGIGERAWLPPFALESNADIASAQEVFVKPDLSVLDADLNGTLYTVALAVQQMRRQSPDPQAGGFRGRIAVAASVCGFYCVPTLPVYTAAKHGLVGFVRSYGALLSEAGIGLNAVCPHAVRTGISSEAFYEKLEAKDLLARMEDVVAAFERCAFAEDCRGGECLEVGPRTRPFEERKVAEYLDVESEVICGMLIERGRPFHFV